jgi:hypothetical protein
MPLVTICAPCDEGPSSTFLSCTLLSGPTTATEYVAPLGAADARARVLAGTKEPVGVGDQRLHLDGAGAGVDLPVGRHDDAAMRIDAAVGQDQLDSGIAAFGRASRVELRELLARPGQVARLHVPEALRVAHVVDLTDREVHADRVRLRHRREERRAVLPDEVPDSHEREARDAVEGRPDLRVRQIERRGLQGRLRRRDLRLGVGQAGGRVVEVLLRDHAALEEALIAIELDLVAVARHLRALDGGLGRRDRRDVFRRLDREQQIAGLHARSVLVRLRAEVAADAGADVGVVVAVQRADGLDVQRHVAPGQGRHVHHGRRRRGGGRLLGVARQGARREQPGDGPEHR